MLNIKNITNIARGKELVNILIRYGFQDFLDRLAVDTSPVSKNITKIASGLSQPVKIRKVLEEMGATFIKMGQLASMRPDLLPLEYIKELEKLQDHVPTLDGEIIINIIEAELDKELATVFSFFDPIPLASGSISQVHRAVLAPKGETVAVKVQRPNIEQNIQRDLDLIEWFATAIDNKFEQAQSLNLPALTKELRRIIISELDFEREASHINAFRKITTGQPMVNAPAVYSAYSTKRVLVMDLITGIKPGRYRGPLDMRTKLASVALLTYIDTVFDAGFFHADPHAGNVLIAHDKLCFLDWGMVGRLTSDMQMYLMQIILAITQGDAEELVRVSLKAFGQNRVGQPDLLISEVQDLLTIFYYKENNQSLGHLLLSYINLLRQQQIKIPAQYVLMCRALLAVEGLSKQIDPNINILQVIKPRIRQKTFNYLNPLTLGRNLANQMRDLIWMIQDMPLANGKFKISHQGLTPLRHALLEAANKLALALVTGSLIVGSSLVITTNTPPLIFGHSAIGLIGYLFSSIFGFMLAFNIIRNRK